MNNKPILYVKIINFFLEYCRIMSKNNIIVLFIPLFNINYKFN